MKTTDINEIYQTAIYVLENNPSAIGQEIQQFTLAMMLTNIYVNNDLSKECTNRILDWGTIITTRSKVSIILDTKVATRAGNDSPLCSYDNLYDDLLNILTWIDFAFNRVNWK